MGRGLGSKPTQLGSQVLSFLPPLQGAALGLPAHHTILGLPGCCEMLSWGAGSVVSVDSSER